MVQAAADGASNQEGPRRDHPHAIRPTRALARSCKICLSNFGLCFHKNTKAEQLVVIINLM